MTGKQEGTGLLLVCRPIGSYQRSNRTIYPARHTNTQSPRESINLSIGQHYFQSVGEGDIRAIQIVRSCYNRLHQEVLKCRINVLADMS